MLVTELPIVTNKSLSHVLNAYLSMIVTELGIVISVANELHPVRFVLVSSEYTR